MFFYEALEREVAQRQESLRAEAENERMVVLARLALGRNRWSIGSGVRWLRARVGLEHLRRPVSASRTLVQHDGGGPGRGRQPGASDQETGRTSTSQVAP